LKGERAYNVFEAQVFNALTHTEKPYYVMLGAEYNYDLFTMFKSFLKTGRKRENGKTPILSEKRYGTIQKKCNKYLKIYQLNSKNERMANWFFEYKLLGYNYSSTLHEIFADEVQGLSPLDDFDKFVDNDRIISAALVTEVKNTLSKKNRKRMLRLQIEDGNKSLMVMLYDKSYDKWVGENRDNKGEVNFPKKEEIIIFSGKKSKDIIFLDNITVMDNKAYLKLSDLKDSEE
jgi:DNA polymerase III alpha subunit